VTVTLVPPDASPERPPSPGAPAPEITVQQLFIWALVGGILPCFGLPVVWTMAAIGWKRVVGPGQRSWQHALLALAIVDTLVAGATLHMAVTESAGGKLSRVAPSRSARMLGINMDPDHPGPGVKVLRVVERSPAAGADLRVGDLVHRANATPVNTSQQLQEVVRDTPPGSPVTLEVEREGVRREVPVMPVEYRAFASPPPKLFEPSQELAPPTVSPGPSPRWGSVGVILAAGALLALWISGRKRGAGTGSLMVLAVLGLAMLGFAVAGWGLAAALGGTTRGGMLLAMWAQTGILCVASLLLLRRKGPWAPGEGAQGWVRTYFVGLGLLITLAPRVLMTLAWLALLLSASPQDSQHPLMGLVEQGALGALGWVLLAIPTALLAPVGEELLFRGLLLPWLHSWMGRTVALVASAAIFASLHAFYGVFTGWIFFLGLLLGWARLSSRGVLAPILLHMTINSFALLMQARSLGS
jgi:membrane protease YdiL (CAAX protease family)